MSFPHWQYFLVIESDLEATSRFVEFSQDNFSTYSVEFTKILLASSSEVDVVAKALCRKIDPNGMHRNIDDYRTAITTIYRQFHTLEVTLPRYGLSFKPWEEWGSGISPDWWKAYNDVKHERDSNFQRANLRNALLSVAGLFSLVLYYYEGNVASGDYSSPLPKIMTIEDGPELIVTSGWKLPDF